MVITNNRNVILTGVPRSGTTLICYLLNRLPDTVALAEPMDVSVFAKCENHHVICDEMEHFFKETRRSIRVHKRAFSKHVDGLVTDNPISIQRPDSGLRSNIDSWGEISITKQLAHDFMLAVKHPAAFTAILEALAKRFPCYAIIRNPLSTLSSWSSTDIPVGNGHAPAAERLDPDLKQALERIQDRTERQLHLLSWYYERYQKILPAESILRYENLVSSGGKVLSVITPQARELEAALENKNNNKIYNRQLMQSLGEKLLNTDGVFWDFYTKESVEALLSSDDESSD